MVSALVAPCTTTIRGLASEVLLEPGEDPVPRRTAVNLDSVESVSVAVLVDRLGRHPDAGDLDGSRTVRFTPVPASRTPYCLDELPDRYAEQVRQDVHHPVLLVGLVILDLLVIHPFEDGNGRVARVLTTALLSQGGYTVGRYVSLKQLVADTDGRYYAALLASTHGWREAAHDPWPGLEYFVEQLATAYVMLGQWAASTRAVRSKRPGQGPCAAPRAGPLPHLRPAVGLAGHRRRHDRNALNDLRCEGRVGATTALLAGLSEHRLVDAATVADVDQWPRDFPGSSRRGYPSQPAEQDTTYGRGWTRPSRRGSAVTKLADSRSASAS